MLRFAQKLYVGCKMIYVGCINSSYNNVAKGICFLDCLYRKLSCKVRAFERHIPLSSEDKVSPVKLDANFVNCINSLYESECHIFFSRIESFSFPGTSLVRAIGVYVLDFFCSGIQLYTIESLSLFYLLFIS